MSEQGEQTEGQRSLSVPDVWSVSLEAGAFGYWALEVNGLEVMRAEPGSPDEAELLKRYEEARTALYSSVRSAR